VDSRVLLGSSPERSFLAPEIAYLAGLAREAQERETGSIESEVISGWIWAASGQNGDFRESRFT